MDMPRSICSNCLRPLPFCYCPHLSQLRNEWPVYIIQDLREFAHAIGTARIAALSLSNCHLLVVDPDNISATCMTVLEELRASSPVLIYPGEQSKSLSVLAELPKRPLIFIDASWRRSRKIMHRLPWLAQLSRYSLAPIIPSRYRIRQQPDTQALSTLEAIAYTLAAIERKDNAYHSLISTMDWVIDQQIHCMGDAVYHANYQIKE
jgi:DTW domain-containing protein YfiP